MSQYILIRRKSGSFRSKAKWTRHLWRNGQLKVLGGWPPTKTICGQIPGRDNSTSDDYSVQGEVRDCRKCLVQ